MPAIAKLNFAAAFNLEGPRRSGELLAQYVIDSDLVN